MSKVKQIHYKKTTGQKQVPFKGKLCIFGGFCKSGNVTHLFHCETSYTFSQQQIYLLYLQAPPLMRIGDMNKKKCLHEHTA